MNSNAPRAIDRGCRRSGLDEVARQIGEPAQRTTDAVDDGAQQTWSKLDGERQALAHDGLAHPQAGGLLEDLKRRHVPTDAQHFGEQLSIADAHELVERNVPEAGRFCEGADDACDAIRVLIVASRGSQWLAGGFRGCRLRPRSARPRLGRGLAR